MNSYYSYENHLTTIECDESLTQKEISALQYLWRNFIDFAYSPYEPDISEMHYYLQRMGKLLGDIPPDALPFSGTAVVGE